MHQELTTLEIQDNPFKLISKDWTLITTKCGGKVNTMTASWGGVGTLWHKDVAFIFIRPQRLTFEYLENSDTFSLNFMTEDYRKQLSLCGSKSGRDVDKIAECGFTVGTSEDTPYLEQSRLALVCRKMYFSDLDPKHFLDPSIDKNYAAKDYHRMYVGEILKVLSADE
ncbi:flavin reductase family protein [Candidatus Soleaferrea massiliensis]|uniref:flavin reductase family protein n=1 Tax=Candidatus Soleaferrea massiliensis TaxID=1470354 RepID=UPI00059024B4|nr:flavin reductase family protein [Candidatus Soleaferrea massiliensis]